MSLWNADVDTNGQIIGCSNYKASSGSYFRPAISLWDSSMNLVWQNYISFSTFTAWSLWDLTYHTVKSTQNYYLTNCAA